MQPFDTAELTGSSFYSHLPGAVPDCDDFLTTLPHRHPVLAREVKKVVATSPVASKARQELLKASLVSEDEQLEMCLQVVEEEQRRRQAEGIDFKGDFRETLPAEERRWQARATLKRAMRERRLADLQDAIAEAEAAEVYAVELDYARNIMKEEREDVARIALKAARESRMIESLRKAITEAVSVGLPSEQIDAAETVLAEEIEKAHSRKVLLDSLKNGSLEHLQAAVTRGEAAGLTPLELDRTRNALAVQQRKAAARESLRASAKACDIPKLKAAIDEAKMAKLIPVESNEAKTVLEQELRKVEARHGLASSEIFRQGGDVETFRAAVHEAQAAGLEEHELKPVLETLAMEDLKISARRNLEFARTGRKGGKISKERMLEITLSAVEEGERCGLKNEELEEARELLVEAKKADARVLLQKAIESRNVEDIHAAIKHGQAVGLSHLAFYEAYRTIDSEERKHEVLTRMANALAKRQIFALKGAIKEGLSIKLPESEFTELRIALKEEERKAAARIQITDAVEAAANDDLPEEFILDGLDSSVEEGTEAGLEQEEIRPARFKALQIRQTNARKALDAATKRKNIEAMKEAIEVGKQLGLTENDLEKTVSTLNSEVRRLNTIAALKEATKSRDLEQCRAALAQAEKICPGTRECTDCKNVLKEEERRAEARDGLHDAVHSRKIEKLSRWIGKGEGAGLHHLSEEQGATLLARAKVVLAEEERKVRAREALKAAELSRSIPALRAAALEAEAAGLAPKEFAQATASLSEELPKAARAGLEAALASRNIKALKVAIKEGEVVGLDTSDLNAARLALGEEQLAEALKRRAAFEIDRAIKDGEKFGVDTLALEKARQAHAVEAKKDNARQMLRESEASRRIDEIMTAMTAARAAGLAEFEMNFANRIVHEERLKLMGTKRG